MLARSDGRYCANIAYINYGTRKLLIVDLRLSDIRREEEAAEPLLCTVTSVCNVNDKRSEETYTNRTSARRDQTEVSKSYGCGQFPNK